MKEKVTERLQSEYKDVAQKINEIEKELLAIDRSKIENRVGTSLLFGVFPSLLVCFILARLFAGDIISLTALSIGSLAATIGISGSLLAIFEHKWDLKGERKEYKIPSSEEEKLEREVELRQEKARLESLESAIRNYFQKINKEGYEFVNNGLNEESVKTQLSANETKVKNLSNMRFVNDYFEDFRTKKKNVLKSFVLGALVGILLASAIAFVPQLMGGVGITALTVTPIAVVSSVVTGALFGTHTALKTNNKRKLFKKKNKELGSLELPIDREPIYLQTRSMLSQALEEYITSLEQNDSLALEPSIKNEEVEISEPERTYQPVQEEVVTLSKKIDA